MPVEQADGSVHYKVCTCALLRQRQRAADLRIQATFGPRQRRMTLKRYDTGGIDTNALALEAARNFVANWPVAAQEGWVIGFWGKPGAGKTHLATAIAIASVKRFFVRPYALSVPALLRRERASFSDGGAPSSVELAARADLLVLDDLGAEYHRGGASTDVSWVDEQLYYILDERLLAGRPTVYTTNLAPADLPTRVSERVWSRIARAQVIPPLQVVPVPGKNRQDASYQALLLPSQHGGAPA